MPYRRTPEVQARLAASRDRILRAAIETVAEHGYQGCSIASVAARAGVATGSVYRHFPRKADLVAEVFRVASGREVAAVTLAGQVELTTRPEPTEPAAPAASASRTARDRTVSMVTTFASRALRAPRLAYALLAEPVDPEVDAERLVFRRAYRDVFAEVLADGVASGELPAQDVRLTAAALVGAIGEALVGPLADPTAADPVPALVTFSLRAIGGSLEPDA
ncbi:TetR/AcrR family transcriptional regulator [Solihabitans fulvus]|uniref:TetR/AcrR family transcriptional regulator n=1 Tax=Solihabitans fulvus TaxID=1892852 RepID=A0A5B2WRZ6_9PSEU|nr:TetR/AcrR family transcriptional regulator [Solihabitans fulvus]KAA2254295.1 TetR/AcrR family transcriptional regulator [Solihabitans fulvus]